MGGKRLALLAVSVLVVGGCGGSASTPTASAGTNQQPSVVATATLTQSQAPTASPSAGLASLAAQYSAAADKGNAAVGQCNKAKAAAAGDLTKSKIAAAECMTAYSAYVADLKAVNWGPAQPQVDKVLAAMDKIDGLVAQMANATSDTTFRASYNQLAPAEVGLLAAANALRKVLGLPPVTS